MRPVLIRGRRPDGWLFTWILLLTVLGMIFLYSTGVYYGEARFHDALYYFKKQLLAAGLGLLVMYGISHVEYTWITDRAGLFYMLSVALSAAVLVVGKEYNGSKRWLALGPLSFQPAEFAKVAVVLFLVHRICKRDRRSGGLIFALQSFAMILPVVALVGTNNLSTAVILLGIAAGLIFMADPKYVQFLGLGAGAVLLAGIFLAMESYRLERIAVWLNPEQYEKGFQTIQGLYAIGSGGLFGRGLGGSLQKLGFVPEAQNDMIFSVICEETGLFGALLLLLLFALLLIRLYQLSVRARDLEGSLLLAGIMIHIALQVILNVAVVTNSIPNTGITLPFISYGGTSIVFLHGELGMALAVSRQISAAYKDKKAAGSTGGRYRLYRREKSDTAI